MLNIVLDGILDTIKILPYLLITFIILEYMEHKLSKKNTTIIVKNKKYGPLIGSFLGALPQCGFSTMAASLFSNKVITMGTLIAIFLSTSDEMLPIMISEKTNIIDLIKIICFKIIIGIVIGLIIDLIFKNKNKTPVKEINHMCEEEHCSCDHEGIVVSSIIHTLKIGFFILLANLSISLIIYEIGEDTLSNILLHKNIFKYFAASLIGLIPNCASSVIITKLYLSNLITIGTLLSGLLTGSGIGLLLLFKTNKNLKENLTVLSIIYFTGIIIGIIIDILF